MTSAIDSIRISNSSTSNSMTAVSCRNVMGEGDGVDSVPEVRVSLVRFARNGILEAVAEFVKRSDVESEISSQLVVGEGRDCNTLCMTAVCDKFRCRRVSNKLPGVSSLCKSPGSLGIVVSSRNSVCRKERILSVRLCGSNSCVAIGCDKVKVAKTFVNGVRHHDTEIL